MKASVHEQGPTELYLWYNNKEKKTCTKVILKTPDIEKETSRYTDKIPW